jgi:uncharacterized coiled-coil protein SlyX
MSVHQESLEISKPSERMEEAPELEYRAVSHDSLSMFLAAIGGAILGMLLTLLILALINGGTLSFSGGERLTNFEATLQRVNDNVGAVSANVDIVSQQAQTFATQLNTLEQTLRSQLASQDADIASLNTAVSQLDVTRQQFDLFMGALSQAMSQMQNVSQPAPPAAAPAARSAAPPAIHSASPTVLSSAEIASDAIAVVLFVDANGNGVFDQGESAVTGATVALNDSDGATVASEQSTVDGVLFADLTAGQYVVSVEDAAGHTLASASTVEITVAESAEAGQFVYIPVVGE